MKKLIMIVISIIVILFVSICIMVGIDNGHVNRLEEEVLENTDVSDIKYVNKYDNYYIVMDDVYLYLFNDRYEQITSIKLSLLYENKNNYDIVYRDETIMYMDNYKNKEGIIFKYYDIYTYELIDTIVVGGM